TEELERQSEELRVANDEMAQRQKMLETLLELSRSLHVGLSDDDALDQICQTLAHLVNGMNTATAILLAGPDGRLHVRCHHGFGDDGICAQSIAADKSFAQLILERNKSGYLQDLSLRPELEIPQPLVGEQMMS